MDQVTGIWNFDERILVSTDNEKVYPVYTCPLHEARLAEYCAKNGIVFYLPQKKVLKRHDVTKNDKAYNYSKVVYRPMFPSYVFVKTSKDQHPLLMASKSIIHALPVGNQKQLLEEIRLVRTLEQVGYEQKLEFYTEIKEGDRFRIENGAWQGVEGWLEKKENNYFWTVQLEVLQTFVKSKINPANWKMTKLD